MHKYYNGKIEADTDKIVLTDANISTELSKFYDEIEVSLEAYKFRQALQSVMDMARLGNRYLTEQEPWKTIRTDPAKAKEALHNSLILIGHLTSCLQPFLPATVKKIAGMLNLPFSAFAFDQEMTFANGHQLNPSALLFEKVEDDVIDFQMQKLFDKKAALPAKEITITPSKENINFDTFAATDIRTGTIITAEKVAKTKKLLKLTIDTGIDQRTVVSGIAEYFEPEAREIKGILSQGMILMAENAEGKLSFVASADDMHNGSVVR
jgi:methionyl-tRNA synthetase